MKRSRPGQHFVEDRAEAKQVGAVIGGVSANLFRGHVTNRAQHNARFRAPGQSGCAGTECFRLLDEFGEAEVKNLDAPIFGDEQVLWFEVAVDDTLLVGRSQAVSDLNSVINCLAEWHGDT